MLILPHDLVLHSLLFSFPSSSTFSFSFVAAPLFLFQKTYPQFHSTHSLARRMKHSTSQLVLLAATVVALCLVAGSAAAQSSPPPAPFAIEEGDDTTTEPGQALPPNDADGEEGPLNRTRHQRPGRRHPPPFPKRDGNWSQTAEDDGAPFPPPPGDEEGPLNRTVFPGDVHGDEGARNHTGPRPADHASFRRYTRRVLG